MQVHSYKVEQDLAEIKEVAAKQQKEVGDLTEKVFQQNQLIEKQN